METAPFTPTDSAHAPLKRELGLSTATALVVGNMVGSGIFLLPASFARSPRLGLAHCSHR